MIKGARGLIQLSKKTNNEKFQNIMQQAMARNRKKKRIKNNKKFGDKNK